MPFCDGTVMSESAHCVSKKIVVDGREDNLVSDKIYLAVLFLP